MLQIGFLHLGLDNVDAHALISVFFVLMRTQRAKMTETLALCTLKLDNEVLFLNILCSVG